VSEFAFASGAATPRKRPVQDRSRDTVTAILAATIRVLAEDGRALTTTRVAEVAGVSVGTLYQYFPNRQALITGVLADHLEAAIVAVEQTAEQVRDRPLAEATERVVRAFLAAKAARVETSRLLNQVFGIGQLDDRPVIEAATRRAQVVVARVMAGSEPDEVDLRRAGVLCAALQGVVRAAMTEDPDRLSDPAWIEQVVAISVGAVGG
jgi:AcrR family transcriptional regulator